MSAVNAAPCSGLLLRIVRLSLEANLLSVRQSLSDLGPRYHWTALHDDLHAKFSDLEARLEKELETLSAHDVAESVCDLRFSVDGKVRFVPVVVKGGVE